ncbi:AI-2E family transporter, partial [Pseudoruegeria sp. SK021]|uniref:AI-2E family transporter n=1 Tax=Pseudoruegeria sp. SK021 TaxID=1933035 RepID=UPI000A21590F
MAHPAQQQLKYWSIAAVVVLVTLWALGNVLLPFILGCAVAYLLDPIADWLERRGLSRIVATAIISVFFVVVAALSALLILPTLINQAVDLFNSAPQLAENVKTYVNGRFPSWSYEDSVVSQSLAGLGEALKTKGGDVFQGVMSSALTIVNIMVLLIIVPVVSFYMLVDWDRMVARVDDLLPRDHAVTIRRLAKEMDQTLAGFIRGQGMVCFIQGTFYAVALMLAGLNFGLFVGFLAGAVSFIPYVGALVGGVLAIGLALFQFWGDPLMIGVIAGIFFLGQVIEGNVLTPNLVGKSVGLHPVWLLLALSIFGALFGFVGMLVAVPVSALIGVLVRFLVAQYMTGRLYLGQDMPLDHSAPYPET